MEGLGEAVHEGGELGAEGGVAAEGGVLLDGLEEGAEIFLAALGDEDGGGDIGGEFA